MEPLLDCQKCGAPLAPAAQFCSGCGTKPPAPDPANLSGAAWIVAPAPKSAAAATATPLIGGVTAMLFVVVLLLGIVIFIATRGLSPPFQRVRLKRTLADMKTLVEAINRYKNDFSHYPAGNTILPLLFHGSLESNVEIGDSDTRQQVHCSESRSERGGQRRIRWTCRRRTKSG